MALEQQEKQLCPLTLQPLPFENPLKVAVIWNATLPDRNSGFECGHQCTLLTLIRYIQGETATKTESNERSQQQLGSNQTFLCPVCNLSPIISISDLISSSIIQKKSILSNSFSSVLHDDVQSLKDNWDIVAFRYGKKVYRLSVPKNDYASNNKRIIKKLKISTTAQERIAECLDTNLNIGLKILFKGKVIYPINPKEANTYTAATELSTFLLKISKEDIIQNRKKPSLLVMATSKSNEDIKLLELQQRTFLSFGYRLLGLMYGMVCLVRNSSTFVFGSMIVFLRTVLQPISRIMSRRED